jgi:hypothetical protein
MRGRPDFHNGPAWRAFAVLNLLILPVLCLMAVVLHGVPVLWQDLPQTLRLWGKVLRTGRPGPYDGITW